MEKEEKSAASEAVRSEASANPGTLPSRIPGVRLLILLALTLMAVLASNFAWKQHLPALEPGLVTSRDWIDPVERNPHLRFPSTGAALNDVLALGNRQWVVIGQAGTLLVSNDDGISWSKATKLTKANLNAIRKLADGTLLVIGDGGTVLQGSPDAANWTIQTINASALRAIGQFENGNIVIVGDNGHIWLRTRANGDWLQKYPEETKKNQLLHGLLALMEFDGAQAIAVGEQGWIVKSSNSGETWQIDELVRTDTARANSSTTMQDEPVKPSKKAKKGKKAKARPDESNGYASASAPAASSFAPAASASATASAGSAPVASNSTFASAVAATSRADFDSQAGPSDPGNTRERPAATVASPFVAVGLDADRRIVVVTEKGELFAKEQGGKTWQKKSDGLRSGPDWLVPLAAKRVTAAAPEWLLGLAGQTNDKTSVAARHHINASGGEGSTRVAVGDHGVILRSDPQTGIWQQRSSVFAGSVSLETSGDIVSAIDQCGNRMQSTDGGFTWTLNAFGSNDPAMPGVRTLVLGNNSLIGIDRKGRMHRKPAKSDTWTPVTVPGAPFLRAVAVIPDEGKNNSERSSNLVAVGDNGAAFLSVNRGKEWAPLETPTKKNLHAAAAISERHWIAVGDDGVVIETFDGGGKWESVGDGKASSLLTIAHLPGSGILVAGAEGVIKLRENGKPWKSIPVPESGKASYTSILQLPNKRILVGGDGGMILFSDNLAQTWEPIVYRHFPGVWYWLVMGMLLLLALLLLLGQQIGDIWQGMNHVGTSDGPINDASLDKLGYQDIIAGISNFMVNRNTTTPLTLAVTGFWGQGKSSLMNMLMQDLKKYQFRCTWFNPWHYQTEENVLAALLEQIQKDVVPPLLSFQGVRFRRRLILQRAAKHWLISLCVVSLAVFVLVLVNRQGPALLDAANYIVNEQGSDRKQDQGSGLAAQDREDATKDKKGAADQLAQSSMESKKDGKTSASPKTADHGDWFGRLLDVLVSTFPQINVHSVWYSGWSGLVTFVLGFTPLLLSLFKGVQAFSQRASILATNLDGFLGLSRAKAQTSFRANFEKELRQVSDALGPDRIVIFIDDLDRCKPAVVMELMEAINFLSMSANCFVVMGIDVKKVSSAIGLAHSATAKQLNPGLPEDQAYYEYGSMYLLKIVNIEIPIDRLNQEKVLKLLIHASAKKETPHELTPEQKRQLSMERVISRIEWVAGTLAKTNKCVLIMAIPVAVWFFALNLPQFHIPADKKATVPNESARPHSPPVASPGSASARTSASGNHSASARASATVSAIASIHASATESASASATIAGQGVASRKPPESPPGAEASRLSMPVQVPVNQNEFRNAMPTGIPWIMDIPPLLLLLLLYLVARHVWRRSQLVVVHDSEQFNTACTIWNPAISAMFDSPREVKRWINRMRYISARLYKSSAVELYWTRVANIANSDNFVNQVFTAALFQALWRAIPVSGRSGSKAALAGGAVSDPPADRSTQSSDEAQLISISVLFSLAIQFKFHDRLFEEIIHQNVSTLRGIYTQMPDTLAGVGADLPGAAIYKKVRSIIGTCMNNPKMNVNLDQDMRQQILKYIEIVSSYTIVDQPMMA